MRRKTLLVLIGLLVVTWAGLGLPGQEAWAVPGQDPGPSIPTLTPTPAGGSQAPDAPEDSEAPAPPTIPPLTFTPLTVTPILSTESVEGNGAEEETRLPVTTASPLPLETVEPTLSGSVAVTSTVSPLSEGGVATSVCANLAVVGLGLALLIVGLILLRGG